MKKYTSSANEFLLHTVKAMKKLKKKEKKYLEKCTSPAREFLLDTKI